MFERISRSVTIPTRSPYSSVTSRCRIRRRAISRHASATDVEGDIVKTSRVITSRTRMIWLLRAAVRSGDLLQALREAQDIVHDHPRAVGMCVDRQIGPQRDFVIDHELGAGGDLRRRIEPAPLLLSRRAYVRGTEQLHLAKVRDQSACPLAPLAAWRGGVDDHRDAGVGQGLRRVGEGTVNDVTFVLCLSTAAEQRVPYRGQLQHADVEATPTQRPGDAASHRGLPTARQSGDPDGPAHATAPLAVARTRCALPSGGDTPAPPARRRRIGVRAPRSTDSATLPMMSRLIPPRPRLVIMVRSAF